MMYRVVVLGGGVGGTVVANRLARRARNTDVVVIDSHGDHIYQPGLVYVPLGIKRSADLIRDSRPLLDRRVRLRVERAAGIDRSARRVELEGGEIVPYDFLVLATGSRVAPGGIPGFREAASHFHCPHQASNLREAVARFQGGDLVVGASRVRYKCPVAPVEMALLLDDLLSRDGRRGKTSIHFIHPLPGVTGANGLSDLVEELFRKRGIELSAPFETTEIDPESREVRSTSGEVLPFDLLVLVPPHTVAPFLRDSDLIGESGFVPADPRTLKVSEGMYALGDNADLPAPKLGSAAFRQARTVVENILAEMQGNPPDADYDGRSVCFLETGHGRAAKVETAYGPCSPPRRPGRLRYLEKRLFNRLYFRIIARA